MNGTPPPWDLTNNLEHRDWQEYVDACLCHDRAEPVVCHAKELAHRDERVLSTVSTT